VVTSWYTCVTSTKVQILTPKELLPGGRTQSCSRRCWSRYRSSYRPARYASSVKPVTYVRGLRPNTLVVEDHIH
jgi:hypothetical protein